MKKLLVYRVAMKTFYLIILALLLTACGSTPSPKQQMLNDLFEHHQQMKKIEEEIDLGLPKTEEEFYRSLLKDLKSKNTLKI